VLFADDYNRHSSLIVNKITWDDVVKLVDSHPAIEAGRYYADSLSSEIDAAKSIQNPSVKGTMAYGRSPDKSSSKAEWGVEFSIPFYWIATRGARTDVKRADANVAKYSILKMRKELLLKLCSVFWRLSYMNEKIFTLKKLYAELIALTNAVRQKVDKGEARPVEITRLSIETDFVSGALDAELLSFESGQREFAYLLGFKTNKKVFPLADFKRLPQSASLDLVMSISQKHPDVVVKTAMIKVNEQEVKAEKKERIPSFSLQFFTDHELDRVAYGAGIDVNIPIWNLNTGRIHAAEKRVKSAMMQREDELLRVKTKLIDAKSKCDRGIAFAKRFGDRILPAAESVARITERTYQVGESPLLEVIYARRTLLETQDRFLKALEDAHIECARLNILIEKELP
jgi:cobalt-zinc-cadmium efflux system outer membrane protein